MDGHDSQDAASGGARGSFPVGNGAANDVRNLIPNPILCADSDGNVLWINAAAEDLLGISTDRAAGRPWVDFIVPEQRTRQLRRLVRALRQGARDIRLETTVARGSDSVRPVAVQVRRGEEANGEEIWMASAHERVLMPGGVGGSRPQRGDGAGTRNASGDPNLKIDLLSILSQELRAPMNGVIGTSRLLLDTKLDRDQQTFAEVMHDSSRMLLDLVDDILDFSRIEVGQLEIANIDFDLRVMLEGTKAALEPVAGGQSVKLTAAVHHRVPSLLSGDPGRLRQILIALSRDAIRSSTNGRVELRVDLVEETTERVALRFAVLSHGESVSPASHQAEEKGADGDEVLKAFVKDDLVGAARHGGTGLSLGIARRIVALMGGDAGFHAEPGRGRLCWFRVPLGKQSERPSQEPAPVASELVKITGLRVLVADDSTFVRRELIEAFRGWGAICEEAEDGLEALERLRTAQSANEPYGLAMVDLDLAGLDAEALAGAMHDDPTLGTTPLMLMTNFGRPGDAARAEAWGYAAYLVKPLPTDQLEAAVQEVLRRARQGGGRGKATGSGADGTGLVTRHSLAEQRRRRVTVLIVEDSPLDQLVVSSALRRMGYEPVVVADGMAALEATESRTFDVIFMDVRLPEVDGIEAVRGIRRREEATGRRPTPIIAMTGLVSEQDRTRCLEAGMDEFLPKPLDLEATCATVERWVRAAEDGARDAARGNAPGDDSGEAGTVGSSTAENTEAGPRATSTGTETGSEATHATPPMPQPAYAADAAATLDPRRLEVSSMGSPEIRAMLVRAFFTHIGRPMDRLREAVQEGDADAVEFQAHGMKGMCASLGAMKSAALFEELETRGRERTLDGASDLIERAGVELTRVEALLVTRDREQEEAA